MKKIKEIKIKNFKINANGVASNEKILEQMCVETMERLVAVSISIRFLREAALENESMNSQEIILFCDELIKRLKN